MRYPYQYVFTLGVVSFSVKGCLRLLGEGGGGSVVNIQGGGKQSDVS
jgi:hypothetical protein